MTKQTRTAGTLGTSDLGKYLIVDGHDLGIVESVEHDRVGDKLTTSMLVAGLTYTVPEWTPVRVVERDEWRLIPGYAANVG